MRNEQENSTPNRVMRLAVFVFTCLGATTAQAGATLCSDGWWYACAPLQGTVFCTAAPQNAHICADSGLSSGTTLISASEDVQTEYSCLYQMSEAPSNCMTPCGGFGTCKVQAWSFGPTSCNCGPTDTACQQLRCGALVFTTPYCDLGAEACNGADDNCNGLIDEDEQGRRQICEDDECKPGGPRSVGDPVQIGTGGSTRSSTDVELTGTSRAFQLVRQYASRQAVWLRNNLLGTSGGDFTPKPFGSSPTESRSLNWWHSLFTFVRVTSFQPPTGQWTVRKESGVSNYSPCAASAGASCVAAGAPGTSSRLKLSVPSGGTPSQGTLTLDEPDGRRYVYGAHWNGAALPDGGVNEKFFLSALQDTRGLADGGVREIATLTYGTPSVTGGTCPNPAGNASGVPYIATVSTEEGAQLKFYYARRPTGRTDVTHECVIDHINVVNRDTSGESTWVTYQYANGQAGLVSSATWSGTQHTESYAYAGNAFVVSSNGTELSRHNYNAAGQVSQDLSTGEAIDVNYTPANCGIGASSPVCTQAAVTVTSASAGDGSSTAQRVQTFALTPTGTSFTPATSGVTESCTGGNCAGVSTGSRNWHWQTLSNGIEVDTAERDERGNWTVKQWAVATDPVAPPNAVEVRTVLEGATNAAGAGAVEVTNYTYSYGANQLQRVATASRTGVLNGGNATTTYRYDAGNRLTATIQAGYTFNDTFAPTQKFVGTFYFNHHKCTSGTTPDPFNRTIEVHGPCYVASASSTDCDLGGAVPVKQFTYWAATPSSNKANRVKDVITFATNTGPTGCTAASGLATTFGSYDASGNPLTVTDPNGVVTTLTYEEHRVASSITAGAATSYAYDNSKLTTITYPQGNKEVFCYRKNTSQGACSSAQPWSEELQWRARSNDNGATWSERIEYTYWPDGTVKSETFLMDSGTAASQRVRRVQQYQADAHRRPTWSALGDIAGQQVISKRGFDAASNNTGIGFAFNVPPAFCAAGPTTSPLCAGLSYDRADRLIGLDQFPTGSGTGDRTCLSYDAHGNSQSIKMGCATGSTAGDCSSCSQTASTYRHDDFGNVVEALLPWTDDGASAAGATRYTYDARGNVLKKETPAMRAAGAYLEYQYDAMDRITLARSWRTNPSPGFDVLYALSYDGLVSAAAGCPALTNTKGRLTRRVDSFGATSYRYDSRGRVLGEVRMRTGVSACTGAIANDVPHTDYTYSLNGNLTSITYPLGRVVTYGYGTGANADRVGSVSVALFGSAETLQVANVAWEPYGELRAYQTSIASGAGPISVEYWQGGADPLPPGPHTCRGNTAYDHTGRISSVVVRPGALVLGSSSSTLFRQGYSWTADQITQVATCLRQEEGSLVIEPPAPRIETFEYDGLLRLKGAGRSGQSMASTGGSFDSRMYNYDPRGNRSNEGSYGSAGHVDRLTQVPCTGAGCLATVNFSYDRDGRVASRSGPVDSSGTPAFTTTYQSGPAAGGALDSVLRSVSIDGVTYQYFYDAFNRRRLKSYPNTTYDEFFYNTGHSLLVEQGSSTANTERVVEDYVWLGGRPIAFIRGRVNGSGTRLADMQQPATGSCSRHGDEGPCDVYFLVTDPIGKPVLLLNKARKVSQVLEYDPFGRANRVRTVAESAHPYPNSTTSVVNTHSQFTDTARSLDVAYRVRLQILDTEGTAASPVDFVSLKDMGNNATLATGIGGSHRGSVWTPWVNPAGTAGVRTELASNGNNCCPNGSCGGSCASFPYSGVVIGGYEYHRFEIGAPLVRTPLRFPGHYYDEETELLENWNRYYEPATGRYLQPEPMASESRWIAAQASRGWGTQAYAYALNNPIAFKDTNGLEVGLSYPHSDLPGTEPDLSEVSDLVVELITNPLGADDAGEGSSIPSGPEGDAIRAEIAAAQAAATQLPQMPPKIIVEEDGIKVFHNYGADEASRGAPEEHINPTHAHVKGGGKQTKIGRSCKPIKNAPPLSKAQKKVVERNKNTIRKAIRKLGKIMMSRHL